jgi:acyl carrier protein
MPTITPIYAGRMHVTANELLTEEVLCRWIIRNLARLARIDAARLGPETAFAELGLSSLAAVTLATDLSDAFGIDVDALVTWDYPTIGQVARAIVSGDGLSGG